MRERGGNEIASCDAEKEDNHISISMPLVRGRKFLPFASTVNFSFMSVFPTYAIRK